MQRKTYRPNSKRNPWRNTWKDKTKKKVNVHRLISLLLLITIPVFCIGVASGVLTRSADVYQYNLKSTQAVSNGTYFVSEDALIELFGDFMSGKTDTFALKEEVEYEPENVFTAKDEEVMTQYRQVCRRALAAGIGGAVLSLIIYILLIRWKEKDLMRWIMGMSGVSLFLFGGLHVLTLVYGPVRRVVYGRWIDFALPEKDYLVQLVDNSFAVQLAVMTCVAAVIFYLILLYITFRLAGKRNVFKRSVWAEPQK